MKKNTKFKEGEWVKRYSKDYGIDDGFIVGEVLRDHGSRNHLIEVRVLKVINGDTGSYASRKECQTLNFFANGAEEPDHPNWKHDRVRRLSPGDPLYYDQQISKLVE